MSQSIFLNKIKIDIYDKPVSRRVQIADVGDVAAQKSSYSYTIKIPRTAKNVRHFEMLGVIGNTSRKPFEEVVCDYVVDGIFIVANGVAIIKAATGDASGDFQLNIIDGIKGLSDLLSGKTIADIDFTDLEFDLTTQNYIDTYSNTEGLIYCIANYGINVNDLFGLDSVKVEKQAPCIFTHTIMTRIFEEAGLELVGDFFTNNTEYLNEVVTPVKGFTISDSATETSKGGADTDTFTDAATSASPITVDEDFTFTDLSLVGASVVAGDIVFSVAGSYKIDIRTFYEIVNTNLSVVMKIEGVTVATISLPLDGDDIRNDSFYFTVAVGETLSLHLVGSGGVNGSNYEVDYSVSCNTLLKLRSGGQTIKVSDFIGEINQIDFVKDISNRYGLILHPIQNSANYHFKNIEDVLNDRATAEDWTSKFASKIGETYKNTYAKDNKATYEYPDGFVGTPNDASFIVDNFNAEETKVFFASPFEFSSIIGIYESNAIRNIPIWEQALEDVTTETIQTEGIQLSNVYLKSDGTTVASSGSVVRVYGLIDPEAFTYKMSGLVEAVDNALICYYDASDTFISYQVIGNGTATSYTKFSATVPELCKKIRVSGTTTNLPILYRYEEVNQYVVSNSQTAIKVASIARDDVTLDVSLFEEVTPVVVTSDIPFLSNDNMSMNHFLTEYYPSFNNLINNYSENDFYFNLSPVDIYNLDFFRLKYLKQTGRFYYLGSVLHTTDQPSKVKMYEITEFI